MARKSDPNGRRPRTANPPNRKATKRADVRLAARFSEEHRAQKRRRRGRTPTGRRLGPFAGDRREPQEGQVDQQVPGLEATSSRRAWGTSATSPSASSASTSTHGYAPSYEVVPAKKETDRRPEARGRPGRAWSTWRPTPTARARRSPGTSSRPSTCPTTGSAG